MKLKEGNQDSNQQFTAEGINIQLEQNKETIIQTNEKRLRNFHDNFKHSNIQITRMPEREKEEKEIESLFEKIMKENFLNLTKEVDIQEVQEVQKAPTSWTQGRTHQGIS